MISQNLFTADHKRRSGYLCLLKVWQDTQDDSGLNKAWRATGDKIPMEQSSRGDADSI